MQNCARLCRALAAGSLYLTKRERELKHVGTCGVRGLEDLKRVLADPMRGGAVGFAEKKGKSVASTRVAGRTYQC
jgi:hypothetical protein